MKNRLSLVVPAHDPRPDYLTAVLAGLRAQTLPPSNWELVVVDNRSTPPLAGRLDLGWHPDAQIVREEILGLTRARVAGFEHSRGDIVVMVDDDNVLAPGYLAEVLKIDAEFPFLGTWGGNMEPVYERKDFNPPEDLEHLIGGRSVKSAVWSNDIRHHASTPWGAGMCIRRSVVDSYVKKLRHDIRRLELDLKGLERTYGGDADIAYSGCDIGLGKGVFPQLRLRHLISLDRCNDDFMVRVMEGRTYSGVIHEFMLTGTILAPRRDWRGKVMGMVRWLWMSPLQRRLVAAQRRGEIRAYREIVESVHPT